MRFWNDTKLDLVREMAALGCSAAKIARDLGTTRNAVVGKCDRHGIRLYGRKVRRTPLQNRPGGITLVRSVKTQETFLV